MARFSETGYNQFMHFFARIRGMVVALLLMMTYTIPVHSNPVVFGISPETPQPAPRYEKKLLNAESKVLRTEIIYEPRVDTPSKAAVWSQLTQQLREKTGLDIRLNMPESQLEFERNVASGIYDIIYASPLQFLAARDAQNYRALAKRRSQPLRSLIIIRKFDNAKTLRDIEESSTGVSSLLNYTSSVIMRFSLEKVGIDLPIRFYSDERELMNALASGSVRAVSLSESSFYGLSPDRQEQYKILWETPGFTPFAFATHPRMPFYSINKLQRAMVNLNRLGKNQTLLELLNAINGYEIARNSDWLDAEAINLDQLNNTINLAKDSEPQE